MTVTVSPGNFGGTLPAIASKSCAHRLLICAALSKLPVFVSCRAASEDILATAGCLRALGAGVRRTEEGFAVTPMDAPRRGAVEGRWPRSTSRWRTAQHSSQATWTPAMYGSAKAESARTGFTQAIAASGGPSSGTAW